MRQRPNPEDEENQNPPNGEDAPFQLEVTDVLDLHTFSPREVRDVVEEYLYQARTKGYRSVRLIHGKGKGVQRAQIHSLLQRTPGIARFEEAPTEAGGWGATVVWFA